MLNETLEYKQYTCRLDGGDPVTARLKHKTLTPDLKGINRAMTIVARHFLFPADNSPAVGKDELMALARAAVAAWCGHGQLPEHASEELRSIDWWLPRYMTVILAKDKMQKLKDPKIASGLSDKENTILDLFQAASEHCTSSCAKKYSDCLDSAGRLLPKTGQSGTSEINNIIKAMITLRNSATIFPHAHFAESDDSQKNDRNAITYERVLGNAVRLGPLREFCLASRIFRPEKRVTKISDGKYCRFNSNAADITLKLTAACLLELTEHGTKPYILPAQSERVKAVKITMADVENWLCRAKLEKKERDTFFYKGDAAQPRQNHVLFEGVSLSENLQKKDNILKIRLNSAWLYDCGWELIPCRESTIIEFLNNNPDGCVYRDCGAGRPFEFLANTAKAWKQVN